MKTPPEQSEVSALHEREVDDLPYRKKSQKANDAIHPQDVDESPTSQGENVGLTLLHICCNETGGEEYLDQDL